MIYKVGPVASTYASPCNHKNSIKCFASNIVVQDSVPCVLHGNFLPKNIVNHHAAKAILLSYSAPGIMVAFVSIGVPQFLDKLILQQAV